MYNVTGAAADVFRRIVYPCLTSAWAFVHNLTGTQRRLRNTADTTRRASDKRRHLDSWNKARNG